MREIKFRAWDAEEKNFICFDALDGILSKCDETYRQRCVCKFEQFTGLHDKNGKEIYEGDVVRITAFEDDGDIFIHRIYWDDVSASFKTYGRTDGWDITVTPESTEVIGNIHENPELLEASC